MFQPYLGTGLSAKGRVPISNPRGGVAEIDAKGGVRGVTNGKN